MAELHDEREVKYDVPADFTVPDLAGLGGAALERSTIALISTYYDTADHALLAHHVTLRRREGDEDTGWHLKVPGDGIRTEIRVPLTDGADVPAELADLVVGIARSRPLAPVAELRTERRLHRLRRDDRTLLEIADDHVHASVDGDALRLVQWREVETELGSGAPKLLDRVGRRLVAAGAAPARSKSKLARALDLPDGWSSPALRLVGGYLDEQLEAIGSGDVALRRGLDAVHRTRVAVRRYRSVLRVFATVFIDDVAALDAELAEYQQLLGAVRDRQVQRDRFAAALHRLPDDLILGPVASDIDTALAAEQADARAQVMTALDGDRYRALLAAVVEFTRRPPLEADTGVEALLALAEKAQRTARRRLTRALHTQEAEAIHRARKAHKRARYAAELVAPAGGKSVRRLVKADKHVQDVLGEHQDSVDAAAVLRRLGAARGADANRNGFTYGILWQLEQEAADRARKAAARLA
jgi:CHAD domain-containing protein